MGLSLYVIDTRPTGYWSFSWSFFPNNQHRPEKCEFVWPSGIREPARDSEETKREEINQIKSDAKEKSEEINKVTRVYKDKRKNINKVIQ